MPTNSEKAINVLLEISENADLDPDTRIRAASAILTDGKTPPLKREEVPAGAGG